MKLSCSAYQAGSCSYAQKILSGHSHQNYGATSSTANPTGESTHGLTMPSWKVEEIEGKCSPNDNSESINEGSSSFSGGQKAEEASRHTSISSHSDGQPPHSDSTGKTHDSSRSPSESPAHRLGLDSRSRSKSVGEQQWTNLRAVMAWYARLRRIKSNLGTLDPPLPPISKSNQRWMKLRTTVQLSGAITSTVQKKATLKREDSFLKRFSTRQVPEAQETFEIGEDDGSGGGGGSQSKYRRKKKRSLPRSVVNPDGNFYFYWLFLLTVCVLYNLWTLIVRESFPELQTNYRAYWITADILTDLVIFLDLGVQFRTGYLEQGLMVYKTRKLANHYAGSKHFWFDIIALLPTDLLQLFLGTHPMFRIPRFLKTYRMYNYYYMVESRTVYPNVWRVVNLIHILLLLAHWFGCFYYLISEAEGFHGNWVYPHPGQNPEYAPLIRKYLGSLYWSTLTLTTIGDLPTPYSNWQLGNQSIPFDPSSYSGYRNHSHKSRLLHIHSNNGYLFTIVSYLIGVFIFATIVGQVGNVITNRNANRLEFERLLDGAKMYMRHHRVPRDMQRRVLRWYDYSWSRGRIQGGGDINTALGLLPDKLKTELALHVNLSVLKKVTIFQECQPEFLHDLVLKMKAYIFTPGDLICRKGEVAREMFIIADGILEVISETGRVLTTMQAGDFFGEIGILNLDGLNKRTADVRSVGYSELFSLSREDVLAAMKDYPEAQDILQTLGRKRLMEARKANAPVKKVEKKGPLTLLGHSLAKAPDDDGESTTGKRIVEKLRSDVKGLRNAIRKSRKSNSSKEDSSEPESGKDKLDGVGGRRKESTVSVQYTGGGASIVGSMIPSSAAGRGVLKRMHNVVLSDEMEKVGIGGDTTMSNLSPTILPKRVQMQLPGGDEQGPGSSRSGSSSGDREVIGAGLPLIQRLRLLKQKEEKERQQIQTKEGKVDEEKPVLLSKNAIPHESESSPLSVLESQAPPTTEKSTFQTRVSVEPPPPPPKTSNQWKQRIRLGSPSKTPKSTPPVPSPLPEKAASLKPPNSKDSQGPSSESTSETAVLDEQGLATSIKDDEPRNSGREPRPSALRFQKRDPKNYGSVDDLSPEFSRLPFIKKLKILNERQKIAELLTSKTSTLGLLTRSTSEGSSEIPQSLPPEAENMHSLILGRRTQSSSEPYGQTINQSQGHPRRDIPPPFILPLPSPSSSSSSSPDGKDSAKYVHMTTDKRAAKKDQSAIKTRDANQGLEEEPIRIRAEINQGPIASGFGIDGSGLSETVQQASPPYSPENNETPERRHLKSILKTLAKSKKGIAGAEAVKVKELPPVLDLEEAKLLKAPTAAGYAARHRKFAKNVTFQRQAVTVVSPTDAGMLSGEYPAEHDMQKDEVSRRLEKGLEGLVELDIENTVTAQLHRIPLPLELMLGIKKEMDESGGIPSGLTDVAGLGAGHLGFVTAQEECIGSVFLGIKHIIQSRMEEFQLRFQDRFSSLEKEVRQRDEIISLLQLRIQELEEKGLYLGPQNSFPLHISSIGSRRSPIGSLLPSAGQGRALGNGASLGILENHHDGDSYDEDEDEEDEGDGPERHKVHRRRNPQLPPSSYLFSRGDSIDTVIDNTEGFGDDDDVFMEAEDDSRRASRSLIGPHVNSQWTVAERESIEMTEFSSGPSIPLWQLEFHREATSATAPATDFSPPQVQSTTKTDAVTVDIGNTSTEYESTSSEEDQKKEKPWATAADAVGSSRQLKEIPFPLDDSGKSSEEEEDAGEDEGPILESSDSDEFDNQNWEVQMLAKEMTKREELESETAQLDDLVVNEMLELDNEIQEMRDVVNSGALSPTELDMLEGMLERRTERVQALFKACSVDDSGRPVQSSASSTTLSKPTMQSIDDFRPRTSVQYSHLPYANFQRRGSKQWSPGDRMRAGEVDSGLHKVPNVRRQASLSESGFPAKLAGSYLSKRRESAGSMGFGKAGGGPKIPSSVASSAPVAGKSFLSRFNFMRSLSRTFLFQPETSAAGTGHSEGTGQVSQRLPDIDSADSPPYSVSAPIQIPMTSSSSAETSFTNKKYSPSQRILPLLSSTTPSSVKSDPGTSQSVSASMGEAYQPIFTIPASSSPTAETVSPEAKSHHHRPNVAGESQPLLKK